MATDPSIPLSIKTFDGASPLMQFAQMRQQGVDNAQKKKVVDAQVESVNLKNLDDSQKMSLKSTVYGASELASYLENDDIDGAENFLNQRKSQLVERAKLGENVDMVHTDTALQLLRTDPEKLKQETQRLVKVGTQAGILKESVGKGFNLKPGETRYDAQGNPLVSAPGSSNAGKVPTGYRQTPEGNLEAIPGGPAVKVAAGEAGKLSLAKNFQESLPNIRKNLVENFDKVDFNLMRGETGRARRQLREAIGAALYIKTGAAATESEVDEQEGLYMPTSFDGTETRKQKIDGLENFLGGAANIVATGRGGSQEKLQEQQTQGQDTQPIIEGKINYADPRVQEAFDNGYTVEQIKQHLGNK